jgi:hypothetical protein
MLYIFHFSLISVYEKHYLDKGSRKYWPQNTDYLENPDSRKDLYLLQL